MASPSFHGKTARWAGKLAYSSCSEPVKIFVYQIWLQQKDQERFLRNIGEIRNMADRQHERGADRSRSAPMAADRKEEGSHAGGFMKMACSCNTVI